MILRGQSGTGKSTFAIRYVLEHKGWARVNKDDIRTMLFGRKDHGIVGIAPNGSAIFNNNFLISGVRDYIILSFLENGYNVIVDGCHLKDSSVEEIKRLIRGKAKVSLRYFVHSFVEV